MSVNYEPDYLEGIEHFNAHRFFEAHEAWEDVWARTTGRDQLFYKGLIHAAVALHHFGNCNLHGARKVWGSCEQYLRPYAPSHLGLDLERFLAQLDGCFASLRDPAAGPHEAELDESVIPIITLEPGPE